MKQLAKFLSLLVLVYLLSAASAQADDCRPQHCDGLIERINLDDDVLQIVMVDDMSPLRCNLIAGKYLTIKANRPSFREMHGMLLGAMLSARPIFVRLENTSDPCEIRYVSLGK